MHTYNIVPVAFLEHPLAEFVQRVVAAEQHFALDTAAARRIPVILAQVARLLRHTEINPVLLKIEPHKKVDVF